MHALLPIGTSHIDGAIPLCTEQSYQNAVIDSLSSEYRGRPHRVAECISVYRGRGCIGPRGQWIDGFVEYTVNLHDGEHDSTHARFETLDHAVAFFVNARATRREAA